MKIIGSLESSKSLVFDEQLFQKTMKTNQATESVPASGNFDSVNLDWSAGNYQIIDLSSATEDVTINLSTPKIGLYTLYVKQHSTVVIDTIFNPSIGISFHANSIQLGQSAYVLIAYDGTNYYSDQISSGIYEHSENRPYGKNELVRYANDDGDDAIYVCKSDISGKAFDADDWTIIAATAASLISYADPAETGQTSVELMLNFLNGKKPVISSTYASIDAMLTENDIHAKNALYEVTDCSAGSIQDTRVQQGWVIYKMNGGTAGDLTDYTVLSAQRIYSTELGFDNTGIGIVNAPETVRTALAGLKDEISTILSNLKLIDNWDAIVNAPVIGNNAKYDDGADNSTVSGVDDTGQTIAIPTGEIGSPVIGDTVKIVSADELRFNTYTITSYVTGGSLDTIGLETHDDQTWLDTDILITDTVISANAVMPNGSFYSVITADVLPANNVTIDTINAYEVDNIVQSNGAVWNLNVGGAIASAVDVLYTPTNTEDWVNPDPGNVREALDVLRTDVNDPSTKPRIHVYVDADAIGVDDGTSWTDAYTSIATAITNAKTGSTIHITTAKQIVTERIVKIITDLEIIGGYEFTNDQLNTIPTDGITEITGDINGDQITLANGFLQITALLFKINNVRITYFSDVIDNGSSLTIVDTDRYDISSLSFENCVGGDSTALKIASSHGYVKNLVFDTCSANNSASSIVCVHSIAYFDNIKFMNCTAVYGCILNYGNSQVYLSQVLIDNLSSSFVVYSYAAANIVQIVNAVIRNSHTNNAMFCGSSGGSVEVYNSLLYNNTIDNSALAGVFGYNNANAIPATIKGYNCTIIGDNCQSLYETAGSDDVIGTFENCIVTGLPALAGPSVTTDNTLTINNSVIPIAHTSGSGANNIVDTPTFIDDAIDDYRLSADSVGVDLAVITQEEANRYALLPVLAKDLSANYILGGDIGRHSLQFDAGCYSSKAGGGSGGAASSTFDPIVNWDGIDHPLDMSTPNVVELLINNTVTDIELSFVNTLSADMISKPVILDNSDNTASIETITLTGDWISGGKVQIIDIAPGEIIRLTVENTRDSKVVYYFS